MIVAKGKAFGSHRKISVLVVRFRLEESTFGKKGRQLLQKLKKCHQNKYWRREFIHHYDKVIKICWFSLRHYLSKRAYLRFSTGVFTIDRLFSTWDMVRSKIPNPLYIGFSISNWTRAFLLRIAARNYQHDQISNCISCDHRLLLCSDC